jgi:hypothetical protein
MCRPADSLPKVDGLHPRHLAWDGLRPAPSGVVFSKLSKLLNQEDALSAPCLQDFRNYRGPINVARRSSLPAGASVERECCGQAGPLFLMLRFRLLHLSHHADRR